MENTNSITPTLTSIRKRRVGFLLLLLASISVVGLTCYESPIRGLFYASAYALGAAAIPSVIAILMRPRPWAFVFCLASFMLLFGHRNELRMVWEAKELVTEIKKAPSRDAAQKIILNSNNRIGNLMSYTLRAAEDSNRELTKILASLSSPEIDGALSKSTLSNETKLRASWNSTAEKERIAETILPEISSIFERERSLVRQFLIKEGSLNSADQTAALQDIQRRHNKALDYYAQRVALTKKELGELRDLLAFRVNNFASFQVAENGAVLFNSTELLSEFNFKLSSFKKTTAGEQKLAEAQSALQKELSSMKWLDGL